MVSDTAHAVLTIDLGAIVANWRLLSAITPCGAVVKADAYGLGVAKVAPALFAAGCQDFFVATPDEALSLRAILPQARIVSLGGLLQGTETEFVAGRIIPALGSLGELDAWSRAGPGLPAWIHIDTGMSRLGFDEGEFQRLASDPRLLDRIDLRCAMSHFVSSEIHDDPLNDKQVRRFLAARKRLPAAAASLANSSGIFLGHRFDIARPGAALYGINPTPHRPNPMRPVVTLRAKVLQLREIPAGATAGYNATWTAPRASRIATVGVGYADGWQRGHSNAAAAFFDGHPVSLVGRVSMDFSTFDVTDLPAIRPGSWLELLGPHRGVDEAARASGLFNYEMLTSLGRRFRRDYLPA